MRPSNQGFLGSSQNRLPPNNSRGAASLPQNTAFAAELRRQIEFQQELKECLDPALVDGVVALLAIQLREIERGQPEPQPVAQPVSPSRALRLDRKSEADLVNLLMAVVTVDGLTKNVELRRIREYFQQQLGYTCEGLQRIDALVQKAQEEDLEPDALTLARPFLSRPPEDRILIYSACADIAFADDELVAEEEELLATLARLFQIDAQQSAELHEAHSRVSLERQQSMELKVRGQFPMGSTVRFESNEEPTTEAPQEPEPQTSVSSEALNKTAELMAIHLAQKKGQCSQNDEDWSRLWRGCPEVAPPPFSDPLSESSVLRALPAGVF